MNQELLDRAHTARERLGQSGRDELRALLENIPFVDRDPFVDALLGLPETPDDVALPQGAVPYLPCGVDDILAAVRDVPLREDDTFIDLGSGLGRVSMLVNLLTGARAHGLELQPHLVGLAREHAAKLGLDRVSFECHDVRDLPADRILARPSTERRETSDHGSGASVERRDRIVLFLFAPFNGEMLASALDAIRAFVEGRDVVVCTVAMELPDLPWLERVATPSETLAVFRAR